MVSVFLKSVLTLDGMILITLEELFFATYPIIINITS